VDRVVVDTGPIVALFDRTDQYHGTAVEFVRTCTDPLVSNLAVLTEAMFLLDFSVKAQTACLTWVSEGAVVLEPAHTDDLRQCQRLMEKYADLPMDFADASLVTLCDRLGERRVATMDQHFSVYRLAGGQRLLNVFPTGSAMRR